MLLYVLRDSLACRLAVTPNSIIRGKTISLDWVTASLIIYLKPIFTVVFAMKLSQQIEIHSYLSVELLCGFIRINIGKSNKPRVLRYGCQYQIQGCILRYQKPRFFGYF